MNTSQQSTWNTMPFLLLRLSRRRHQVQQLKRQLIVTEPPLDFISALATFGRYRDRYIRTLNSQEFEYM